MKLFSTILLLGFSISLFSQDTLITVNDDTIIVDVIGIDSVQGIIIYKADIDTMIGAVQSFNKILIQSSIDKKTLNPLLESAKKVEVEYTRKKGFFSYPADPKKGAFNLAIHLTSLFEQSADRYESHQILNRVLVVEPEYYITNKLSLRFPVGIGISRVKPDVNYALWSMYAGYSNPVPPEINVDFFLDGSYFYPIIHPSNCLFQVGIYSKHFSSKPRKSYVYFSQGLNYGLLNVSSQTLYHHLLYYAESDYWDIVSEGAESKANIISFLQYELAGGLFLTPIESISIFVESGFSFCFNGKGDGSDHIYNRINNGEYRLAYVSKYTPDQFRSRIFLRFGLSIQLFRIK